MRRPAGSILLSILTVILFGLLTGAASMAAAPSTVEAMGQPVTKGEAVRLLAAADFIKNKIGELLSWSIGYDISAVNRARLVPSIRRVTAQPILVPPDGRTVLLIKVQVDDPGGLGNISGVRADLSDIGQLPNMSLVDNGLWGDEVAGDGVYTVQTSVAPGVLDGKKEISVAVANKQGWLTVSRTSLNVEKNPLIIWSRLYPSTVVEGEMKKVFLEVSVLNPGRSEDLLSVSADLGAVGGDASARLNDIGRDGDRRSSDGVYSLQFVVPAWAAKGTREISVTARNLSGGESGAKVKLVIE
jgi:hypothetical protein